MTLVFKSHGLFLSSLLCLLQQELSFWSTVSSVSLWQLSTKELFICAHTHFVPHILSEISESLGKIIYSCSF